MLNPAVVESGRRWIRPWPDLVVVGFGRRGIWPFVHADLTGTLDAKTETYVQLQSDFWSAHGKSCDVYTGNVNKRVKLHGKGMPIADYRLPR